MRDEKQRRDYYINVESKKHCNYDFSPLQQNLIDLNHHELLSLIHKLHFAVPKSQANNKYSCRKGVYFDKHKNKWVASLGVNGKKYKKTFSTESEAIAYREHLEDLYYTKEQLHIRNKYK